MWIGLGHAGTTDSKVSVPRNCSGILYATTCSGSAGLENCHPRYKSILMRGTKNRYR